jgi:hypothetical protein
MMVTLAEQIAEAQRELALRRRAYPGFIKRGTLSMEDANRQLLAMAEIVKTLQRLEVEQRQLSLFATHG